ncbi:hypothetical protein AKN87_03025 [Thiopseudomonas alkaliphila]|uniref:type VI secretion system-associated protein TagF n=1 Tax=Thiopseudomonas alkaliphila TaxID=1697053 RepID=UPI00069CF01C|nr:type VI secretion system-associated protein TagF [Thiopseudomonas alkaliphila]AKX44187.1 hypothetical protein AKN87_03025 [Thiopseudomonas alkaliphila]
MQITSLNISYFGKLRSQADFIKSSSNNHQLIARLDQWVGETSEALAHNIAWKQLYDLSHSINFALMGSRNKVVISGHLLPSQDASGRRFPFITATALQVSEPLAFIARSPFVLSPLWNKLNAASQALLAAKNVDSLLQQLLTDRPKINLNLKVQDAELQRFLEGHTLGSLQALLETPQRTTNVRRIFLALGILLQPIMNAGSTGVGKGILLPLPDTINAQYQVAGLWMDLIAGFLKRADFRVLLLQRQTGPAMLAIGFSGLESNHLQAMFNPQHLESNFVPLYNPEWVDDHIDSNPSLTKLATYTEHRELSLSTARDTFHTTFLGA